MSGIQKKAEAVIELAGNLYANQRIKYSRWEGVENILPVNPSRIQLCFINFYRLKCIFYVRMSSYFF